MPALSRTFDKKHLTFDLKSVVSCQLSVVRKAKGFTLIELLVVISIISILATLTLASYNGAQAKARDGVRKNDLAQVKRALELAKADCINSAYYPYKTNYTNLTTFLKQGSTYSSASYMNPIPIDPKTGTSPYQYDYYSTENLTLACPTDVPGVGTMNSGSSDYTLKAVLERTTDTDGQASWTRCTGKPSVPGTYTAGNYYVCNN